MSGDSEAPPRSAILGPIIWPSFFSAGVASMVLFALVDPLELHLQAFPRWHISREMGYALGFLLLWSACAAASLFTWLLLRPADRVNTRQRRD